MVEGLGDILSLATGVALSPTTIIAALLILVSENSKSMSLAFMIGWISGIVLELVMFTLLSSVLTGQEGGAPPILGAIEIILGLALLLVSVREWRRRPAAADQAVVPKWMSTIDSMSPVKSLVLGLLLAVVPKNLLLAASAGLIIGSAPLSLRQDAVIIFVFTVLAGCTVLIPVILYLSAPARMAGPLEKQRDWLVGNNATIMAVLMLVIGMSMLGKGIGSFE